MKRRTCQNSGMYEGGERVLEQRDGIEGRDMKKQGSPVSSAGTGFIKALPSPQALTAKVMTGGFRGQNHHPTDTTVPFPQIGLAQKHGRMVGRLSAV